MWMLSSLFSLSSSVSLHSLSLQIWQLAGSKRRCFVCVPFAPSARYIVQWFCSNTSWALNLHDALSPFTCTTLTLSHRHPASLPLPSFLLSLAVFYLLLLNPSSSSIRPRYIASTSFLECPEQTARRSGILRRLSRYRREYVTPAYKRLQLYLLPISHSL